MATIKFLSMLVLLFTFGSSGRTGSYSVDDERPESYRKLVLLAEKEIGVREEGLPNAGKRVLEYLHCTGIKYPAKWCAAFVSFVHQQAGFEKPRTAWSPDLFPASRQVKTPQAGHVLGIYYASLKRIGHCGIVTGLQGDFVYSVEGNTSPANERDGEGVWRKIRHKRSIKVYADWTKGNARAEQEGGKP